jgi:hypothetical protein
VSAEHITAETSTKPEFSEEAVHVAWHSVLYNHKEEPVCAACLSTGDDECPVMKIVRNTKCPFPDDPELDDIESPDTPIMT